MQPTVNPIGFEHRFHVRREVAGAAGLGFFRIERKSDALSELLKLSTKLHFPNERNIDSHFPFDSGVILEKNGGKRGR